MAANYEIQAQIVDIRVDRPRPEDFLMVDTNVWYWHTYTNANVSALSYQINSYPDYLAQAVSAQSILMHTGLSLSELSHRIEKTEYDLFIIGSEKLGLKKFKLKEYRHNRLDERKKVVKEIETAWSQVTSISASIDVIVNEAATNLALSRLQSQLLDGYDLFMLEAMQKEGITQIITDDGDFVTVPGITVFTANSNVIKEAESQHKLLTRQ
jgi:predicted nucleic acid-binding protein